MYCSKECQTADWAAHRKDCKKLRKDAIMEKNMFLAQKCRSVPVVAGRFLQAFRTLELDTGDIFLQSRIIAAIPDTLRGCYCELAPSAPAHTFLVAFPLPTIESLKPISPFATTPPSDRQQRISPRFHYSAGSKKIVYEMVVSVSEGTLSATVRNVSSDDELARSEGLDIRSAVFSFAKQTPTAAPALVIPKHKGARERVVDSFVECCVGESRCVALVEFPVATGTLPTRADIAAATGVSKETKGKEGEAVVCFAVVLELMGVVDSKARFEETLGRRLVPRTCQHPALVDERMAAGVAALRAAGGVEVVWSK